MLCAGTCTAVCFLLCSCKFSSWICTLACLPIAIPHIWQMYHGARAMLILFKLLYIYCIIIVPLIAANHLHKCAVCSLKCVVVCSLKYTLDYTKSLSYFLDELIILTTNVYFAIFILQYLSQASKRGIHELFPGKIKSADTAMLIT